EPAQAPSMPDILDTADLSDEESAELAAEIRDLRAEAEAADDPDEAEDLRAEATELEQDLRARQQELTGEREEAAREAQAAELTARQEAVDRQTREAQRAERRAYTSQDWTGFYIGLNAGYGFGDEVSASNALGTSPPGDIDGIDFGVQLGFSHQSGRFVVGLEGDYQVSDQSGTTDLGSIGFPGSSIEYEQDSFGTVRIRGGFAAGQALFYATGGYAFADVNGRFEGPIAIVEPDRSVSFSGFTGGVGAEKYLSGQFSLKGEVLYIEFDDEPEIGSEGGSFNARIGVNWRF
ncbi:MAG: outer membrane beta-barrel protein, partial [Acidobacteriota bacterium]